MTVLRIALAALILFAAHEIALAHGGQFRGPAPGGGGSTGQVPPGTADPPAGITRWETWWAANKETYLELHERMREDSRVVTGKEDRKTQRELRAARDKKVRAQLVPVFIEALGDGSFEVRTAAAVALGKTGDARGSKPLRHAARKDTHKDVRDSSVLGLGLLGRQENIPFLESVLSDFEENTRHRSFAAFALGLIGGDDATSILERFLIGMAPKPVAKKDNQGPLLSSCFVAIGLTGRPEALPVLRDALGDKRYDTNTQSFIVLSLGRMRDRLSLDRVLKLLDAKDAYVRRSAAIALGKIGTPQDAHVLEALENALHSDRDPITRHFAAVAIGGIADDATKKRLTKYLPKADMIDRSFVALALGLMKATDAAPYMRKAIPRERNYPTKSAYFIALGLMGDKDAPPVLERELMATRGDIWVQGYAALALGMLRSHTSAKLMREKLADETDSRLRMNLAVGLGLLHDPEAKRYLVGQVRNRDGSIYERGSAAMSLGVLRMNSAVPDLLDVYNDGKEQELVRAFSIVSLGVLADPSPIPKLARFAIDNNYSVVVDPLNEVLSIL